MQRYFSRMSATAISAMLVLVATSIFAQQFANRDPDETTTTQLVAKLVENFHLSQARIDDNISSKLVDKYIKDLDPQKLYFFESDITEFNKYRKSLDDMLKQGKVDFAYVVFETFLKRVDERTQLAQSLIDQDFDFSVQETMLADADDMTWAKTKDELDDRWRKRIKYSVLTLKLDDEKKMASAHDPSKVEPGDDEPIKVLTPEESIAEIRDRLHKRYRSISRMWHQMDSVEILEVYLSAMTQCFDPHSSYMSPRTLEDFQINMRLSLDGIGAALRSEDGYTTVAEVMPGGAAAKDGNLMVDDKIIGVGQESGEIVDVVEMKLSKVVELIRGTRGTIVRLQVKKAKSGDIVIYNLTRQKIELSQQEVKGRVINTQDAIGRPSIVGVINIPSFYRDFSGAQQGVDNFKSTTVDVAKVLADFRQQNVEIVVIDLRGNGGGALTEAIDVSGLFVDKGPVVQVKEQSGRVKSHDDETPGVAWNGPMVVICNRLSASASEIFAGVIKDYNRGLIVGDTTTHGKGTVQNVMPVDSQMFRIFQAKDRGALKLTIQQFYRVNGDSTQNRGVRSDVVLPSLTDNMELGESYLDNALEFDHIPQARFQKLGFISEPMKLDLESRSKDRVTHNTEFADLQKTINKYLEIKNRKTVSLNEAEMKMDRESTSEELQDQEAAMEKALAENKDEKIFPSNYYNNEVLQIAVDYLKLLKQSNIAATQPR